MSFGLIITLCCAPVFFVFCRFLLTPNNKTAHMQSGHEYVQSGTSGRTPTLRWRLIKQSHTDTHTYTYSKGGTRKSIWQRWQHTSDSWNGTEQLVRWGLCLLVELLTAYGCPTEGQRQIQTVRAVVVTGFGSKFVWVLIKQPPNGETHIEPPAMAAVEAATQCGSRTLRQTECKYLQIEDDKRTDFRSVWAVWERGHGWVRGRGLGRGRVVEYLSIPRMTSAEVADRGRACVRVCVVCTLFLLQRNINTKCRVGEERREEKKSRVKESVAHCEIQTMTTMTPPPPPLSTSALAGELNA